MLGLGFSYKRIKRFFRIIRMTPAEKKYIKQMREHRKIHKAKSCSLQNEFLKNKSYLASPRIPVLTRIKSSEEIQKEVDQLFSFYKNNFSDWYKRGYYSIQRDQEFQQNMVETLIGAIKKHESGLEKMYMCGLSFKTIQGYSYMGKLLRDKKSPLYEWWIRQASICDVCYQEWGSPYYTNRCRHKDNDAQTLEEAWKTEEALGEYGY